MLSWQVDFYSIRSSSGKACSRSTVFFFQFDSLSACHEKCEREESPAKSQEHIVR